jgi:adenine-specific DNA-methyltransferase
VTHGAQARPPGVVYTPKWLARFVVDQALDRQEVRADVRWLDPACGDGVFLVELVERLAHRVDAGSLPALVQKTLFGVDIDPLACVRARAAVVSAVTALSGPQPNGFFADNVRVADFLELDADGTPFDVIVGNPPYVSATSLSSVQKARFLERFTTAWGRLDLYTLFIEQGLRLLAPGGRLGYITPDKWLTAESSRPLRAFCAEYGLVQSLDRFHRHDLFPRVATVPCVSVLTRTDRPAEATATAPCNWWDVDAEDNPRLESISSLAIHRDGRPWARSPRPLQPDTVLLGELVTRISAGLATGLNQCFVIRDPDQVEPELLRPTIRGRDVMRGGELADPALWLLVPYRFGERPELIDLKDYPRTSAYLTPHREALEKRHCVRVWGKAWHDLHDPVTGDLASQPKILLPDIGYEPRFAYDPGRFAPLHSVYYLIPREDAPIDALTLMTILNSAPIAAELRRRAPTAKSGYRRFRAQVLRDLPVPLGAEAGDPELGLRLAHALARNAA